MAIILSAEYFPEAKNNIIIIHSVSLSFAFLGFSYLTVFLSMLWTKSSATICLFVASVSLDIGLLPIPPNPSLCWVVSSTVGGRFLKSLGAMLPCSVGSSNEPWGFFPKVIWLAWFSVTPSAVVLACLLPKVSPLAWFSVAPSAEVLVGAFLPKVLPLNWFSVGSSSWPV